MKKKLEKVKTWFKDNEEEIFCVTSVGLYVAIAGVWCKVGYKFGREVEHNKCMDEIVKSFMFWENNNVVKFFDPETGATSNFLHIGELTDKALKMKG